MNPSTTDVQRISLFLRSTLSSFISGRKQTPDLSGLDWRTLQEIVRGRNLGALFSFCHAKNNLPPPVLQEWQQMKMRTSLENLTKLKVATDISAISEKAGIHAVAMRGIVLAHTLYPDPAMRPMHDIDLLIRPADREQFLAAMKDAGHEPTDIFRSQYVYSIRNVTVEVHWQLLSNKRYRERIDSNALIDSSVKAEASNGFYYRLTDQWELIGLVVHAFTHHNLGQLFSLIDIGLYMRNKDIDWQEIVRYSKDMQMTRMMHLTLAIVNHIFGLELEEKILSHFAQTQDKVEQYFQAYTEQALARISLPTHLAIKRSQFYVAETAANKGREFLRLFSTKERRFFLELLAATLFGKKQKLAP